jgi:RNA polymerase sigma-70 factor (ECF subfamily)
MTDIVVADASAVATMVRLAAHGDETAFARLIAEHHPAMARVAYIVTGDAELTRDAVQAAWSIAWRRLDRLRDPGQVRAWLVAIAANEARQTMRHQRRATIVDISEALDRHGGSDPADLIGVLDLERSLRKLPPDDRVLLALRFVADLDSTEIAAQLGMSASGVRSRLARLLDRMRADLEDRHRARS